MKMEKQKKSVGTIVLVVLLLIVTIVSLILATYAWARYTTVSHNSASAAVAKWDVSFTPGETMITNTYSHVVNQRLAPGTSGQFDMEINSNETEVSYEYRILMKELVNKPTNLHFYANEACTEEITFFANPTIADAKTRTYSTAAATANAYTGGDNTASGTYGRVVIKNNAPQSNVRRTRTIYWKWDYQTPCIYKNREGEEFLPADLNTVVKYTDTTKTSGATTAVQTTKQERIIHDLKEFMRSNGIVEDSATSTANGKFALAANADLTAMQALAGTYTVTDNSITANASGAGSNSATRSVTITKAQIDQVINDAIDTVDGLAARTMSFNVEYTAIQCQTTGALEGKTSEFSPYIDYTLDENK